MERVGALGLHIAGSMQPRRSSFAKLAASTKQTRIFTHFFVFKLVVERKAYGGIQKQHRQQEHYYTTTQLFHTRFGSFLR